jgi:hypothetical protein
MSGDVDNKLRRIKQHLDAASDYAQRAKRYANSEDTDSASLNIGRAANEIDSAISAIARLRRELK